MSEAGYARRVFDSDSGRRRVFFPWRRAARMCWANVRNRRGRFGLTLACVTVTVAFLMSSVTYQGVLARLAASSDVHVRAVLERAGTFGDDPAAAVRQDQQRRWIIALSAILCVVGITNTMLMSVTERSREIGTLKCLGALDAFIVRLLVLESLLVGAVGSAAGAAAGYLLGMLQAGARLEFGVLSAGLWLLPLTAAPVAIAAGTVLTVVSAAYPTYVAARMSPVEAMRVEV